MDLSKLPKLSETPKQSDEGENRPSITPSRQANPPAGSVGEAWLSLAVGLILVLICPRLFQYLLSPSAYDQNHPIFDQNGATVPYIKSVLFWGDLVIYLFALALIIDGIVLMAVRRAGVIAMALAFTILATIANLIYVVMMLTKGYGPQLYSLLAVAFGGYIAISQLAMIKRMRA